MTKEPYPIGVDATHEREEWEKQHGDPFPEESPDEKWSKMMNKNKLRAIHPGEHIKIHLEAMGMSHKVAAGCMGASLKDFKRLLNGELHLTLDGAVRLAAFIGATPDFWLRLQNHYNVKSEEEAPNDA